MVVLRGGAVSYERGTPVHHPPGGRLHLVFKAHRLLYHSTLGSREIKKKKMKHLEVRHDHVNVQREVLLHRQHLRA